MLAYRSESFDDGNQGRRIPSWVPRLFVLVAVFGAVTNCGAAAPQQDGKQPAQPQKRRDRLLEQMRRLAQATTVRYQERERNPELIDSPVFRYDDQPRRFLDATMWVWMDGGRPVAFEKIEAMDRGRPQWATLFTSVADGLLTVKWDTGREYRSTSAGVDFQIVPGAPDVPAKSSARRLAAREVVRLFSARTLTGIGPDTTEEMRLLPAPILEYSDAETKRFQGAVFGLTTSGTNPDLLIVLEPREVDAQSVWNYSVARMTTCGVTLKYREAVVWKAEFCLPPANVFPTWTVFYTQREEGDDDPAENETAPARPADQ